MQLYWQTLIDYLLAAIGIVAVMFAVYYLLPRLGAKKETAAGLALIMPWLLGFLLWTLYPIGASLYYSFPRYGLPNPPEWIGLENYARLLRDSSFHVSLMNSLYMTVFGVPAQLLSALALALLLNRGVRGSAFFRSCFFLPSLTPAVALALVWTWLMHSQVGPINVALGWVGIGGPAWLTDKNWALVHPALALMGLWGIGNLMLIFLAGLQSVPTELYDAAKVDGAGRWATFRQVTLPIALPGLVTGSILVFIPMMGEYVVPQLLGLGRTYLMGNALVTDFLESRNWPAGSARAVLLILVMIVTIAGYLWFINRGRKTREVSVL